MIHKYDADNGKQKASVPKLVFLTRTETNRKTRPSFAVNAVKLNKHMSVDCRHT